MLGVRELDRAVLQGVGWEARDVIERLSSDEWDTNKAKLYRGEAVAVRNPNGGMLKIGWGVDRQVITEAVRSFANRVLQARDEFCETAQLDNLDAEILTGGGVMIPLVRRTLLEHIRHKGTRRIHDLLDEEEPRRVLPSGNASAIEARARQNRELVRGGCAIGGCSVFFDA